MSTNGYKTPEFGEVLIAALDSAASYRAAPLEASRLAAQGVTAILRRAQTDIDSSHRLQHGPNRQTRCSGHEGTQALTREDEITWKTGN